MNTKPSLNKVALLSAFVVMAGSAQAQFTYNSGDVLVCFRNVASPKYDLIVDAGPVSTFTNLAIGAKVTISYTPTQLAKVGTNNVAWSVCAARYNYPVSDDTWLTKPRTSLNTPTSPFNTGTPSHMSPIANDIDSGGLGYDATYISDTVINTATVVAETEAGHQSLSDITGNCYYYWVGLPTSSAPANFGGDAPGVVEQTTPANFSTSGQPVRADFYQLLSRSGTANNTPGKYLGYFEFSTNGVMTYTAGPPCPVMKAVTRNQTTNTISFTTVSGWTYSLYATNNLRAHGSTWPAVPGSSSFFNTGTPQSLKDVTTNGSRFYLIKAGN
jgi:hypothetical protein